MRASGGDGVPSGFDAWYYLKLVSMLLLSLVVLSTFVYYFLGRWYGCNWPLLNCLYMTVVTVTTLGGDVLGGKDFTQVPPAVVFTMSLAFVGIGIPVLLFSLAAALVVEGLFFDVFRRRRMRKQIEKLKGHIVVCGTGETGIHCVEELLRLERPFVAVDRKETHVKDLQERLGYFPYVVGPAEEDETLLAAGVLRASGLIAALTSDKDNLFVTLSARALNPSLRIISKYVDEAARSKLVTAGADSVVSPTTIGGMRLISEMVRPTVVTFLDTMLRERDDVHRLDELTVIPGSPVAGKTLAEADLRKVGDLLVVAARPPAGTRFVYNPKADFILAPGCTVVLLGRVSELEKLSPYFNA